MDKKNTFIGALLLAAAAVLFVYVQRHAPPSATPADVRQEASRQAAAGTVPASAASPSGQPAAFVPEGPQAAFVTASADHGSGEVTTLENSYVKVAFTDFGGAVRDVALKKYPATQTSPSPYLLNELHAEPLLGFTGLPGLDQGTRYTLVSRTAGSVVFRTVYDGRIEVTRTYTLAPDSGQGTDPYQIRQVTALRNLSAKAVAPMHLSLAIGTAAPANLLDYGLQLTTGAYSGSDDTFIRRSQLEASGGILGLGAHDAKPFIATAGPVSWATVQNQFFTSILTPDEPAAGMVTRRVKLHAEMGDDNRQAYGIEGAVTIDVPVLPAHGQAEFGATLYAGPKEYTRLANGDVFKHNEDRVMNFGWFRWFSAILLYTMVWMHGWTANWGVAILLTTLTLKLVFLPFTLSASRSAKHMQKIQPELKALREKYKDNPQKQQAATLELFKKAKVNPAGGCLPILITMPFFFGFFRMLQGAAELRFAPFLWAHDLSAPDTVLTIGNGMLPLIGTFHLNILPLILCGTILLQMKITPQPTVDSSQAWMMKLMPFMFMFFCYNYSCALSLYSSVNGLFTIGQQLVVNRVREAPDAPAAGDGKVARNVTPKRR